MAPLRPTADLRLTPTLVIGAAELAWRFSRSSGPGGQSVNTTDSAVRITHLPTGLVVTCQDEKSQHKNKARAMSLLQAKMMTQAQQQQDDIQAATPRNLVGSGDRSEKIRTYNYPQSRVTDHRIGYTQHNLPAVMNGEVDEFINQLKMAETAEKMANSTN